jgi:hypothetical protein
MLLLLPLLLTRPMMLPLLPLLMPWPLLLMVCGTCSLMPTIAGVPVVTRVPVGPAVRQWILFTIRLAAPTSLHAPTVAAAAAAAIVTWLSRIWWMLLIVILSLPPLPLPLLPVLLPLLQRLLSPLLPHLLLLNVASIH